MFLSFLCIFNLNLTIQYSNDSIGENSGSEFIQIRDYDESLSLNNLKSSVFIDNIDLIEETDLNLNNNLFDYSNNSNEIFVLISDDTFKTNTKFKNDKKFLVDHINNNVVYYFSDYFNLNVLCDFNSSLVFNTDCKKNPKFASYDRYFRPIKIIARRINSTLSLDQIRSLYYQIEYNYLNSKDKSRSQKKVLNSIFIISNTKLLSMLSLIFKNLNVPVIGLDVQKFPGNFELASNADKLKVNGIFFCVAFKMNWDGFDKAKSLCYILHNLDEYHHLSQNR